MLLTNLLSWLPGHSGFGSYVQRVLPAIEGYRLQLGDMGQCEILPAHRWTVKPLMVTKLANAFITAL